MTLKKSRCHCDLRTRYIGKQMPVADPGTGRAFIWLVSSFILASLAIGGGFLVAYMVLPTSSTLFLYVGMILVCLPWCFWLLTCLYRCMSRITGLRIVCGSDDVGGASSKFGGGGAGTGNVSSRTLSNKNANNNTVDLQEDNDGRQVRFAGAVIVNEQGDDQGYGRDDGSSGLNNMSFRSHESEIPLAKSMAT